MRKSIFLVIAFAAVALSVAACQPQAANNDTNLPPDSGEEARFELDRKEIGSSADECSRIRYMCDPSYEPYSEGESCGCVQYGYNVTYKDPATISCIEVYDPVCVWFNQDVQCFAYPCAVTASNSCLAQTIENGAYYTNGECPLPSEGVPSEGKVGENELLTYTYQPKQCQTLPWDAWLATAQFEAGKAPSGTEVIAAYYETKSTPVSDVQRVETGMMTCQACDVCDTSHRFTLKARAGDKAILAEEGWVADDAPDAGSDAVDCTEPRPEFCTKEYMPVCGDNGKTYGNKCDACSNSEVNSYKPGECNK